MGDFPMFKLGTLLARQLSSPIANAIKNYTRSHPGLSRSLCMTVARRYKAAELRVKLHMMYAAHGYYARTPPRHNMSDQDAINTGADILGEVILFALGASIIIFEYNRQANIKEAKKLDKKSQWMAMLLSLEELKKELVLQQQELEQLALELQQVVDDRIQQELQKNQQNNQKKDSDH